MFQTYLETNYPFLRYVQNTDPPLPVARAKRDHFFGHGIKNVDYYYKMFDKPKILRANYCFLNTSVGRRIRIAFFDETLFLSTLLNSQIEMSR